MSKKVLFIDDQLEEWGNALREELEPFGFEVKGEEDPAVGLKAIGSWHPDVVMLDILFPSGQLGKPTLERIKREYPNLPVMMITSTMDKTEYKAEDYVLADYRYSKAALIRGDFSDLAAQLNKVIEKARVKKQEKVDDTGLDRFGFIVGKTKVMKEVAETVEKVADQDQTVLITGESGTGKELVAMAIHRLSRQADNLFVPVVCSAIPKDLFESELFGIEPRTATDVDKRIGKIEAAGDGTIFFDEIGEVQLDTQVKLLRFLQEKKFERVGGKTTLTSKARIIVATNQDLKDSIRKGSFREDFYFRLNVVPIHMPPLLERKEDIPVFFEHFIRKANKSSQKNVLTNLRGDVKNLFVNYPWIGNIREMENVINRAVALADENILQVSNFDELTKEGNGGSKFSSDVSEIVEQIYKRELTWAAVCKEFGAQGSLRKEVLLRTIDRWFEENHRRPSSEELAALLSVSPGNMRRILWEYNIKLTKIG